MLSQTVTSDDEIERLYREQGGKLWRAVLALSGDREVASDAVAEAYAQMLRRGEAVREPSKWVWMAAFRIAAGELADRRRRGGVAQRKEETYEMAERAEELIGLLSRLSPNQRASVVLHHYAGYPVKEIAEIIGSTGPAVRVHLSRGCKRLRELLAVGGTDA